MFIILVITLVGIVILNETSSPISGTALSSTKKIHTEPRSCWKLTKALHSSEIQRLSQINLLSEKDETVGTSQFETSWASLMNTLEKIQRMIDDLRRLVETLHQLTQAFIAVVNELSYWIDQVSIDPNVLSSI